MIRYFVYLGIEANAAVLGLRYDSTREKLVIGGYTKHEAAMVNVIDSFLPKDTKAEKKMMQRNKVQYVIDKIDMGAFVSMERDMRAAGITLAQTDTLRNIMR